MSKKPILIFCGGALFLGLSVYCAYAVYSKMKRHTEEDTMDENDAHISEDDTAVTDYCNVVDKLYGTEDTKGVPRYTPYVISYEDYCDVSYEDYEREALTLYSDGVLTRISDEIIEDPEEIIGKGAMEALMNPELDVVYVRDDSNYVQYEIDKDLNTYAEVVGSNE